MAATLGVATLGNLPYAVFDVTARCWPSPRPARAYRGAERRHKPLARAAPVPHVLGTAAAPN
jgi:hypothetical protein